MDLSGCQLVEVAPGTEVEHEGECLTVTDQAAVACGPLIYVTPNVMAKIRLRVPSRHSATSIGE